jgi:AraC-like DNA-binding protein
VQIFQEIRPTPDDVKAELSPYKQGFVIDLYFVQEEDEGYFPVSVKVALCSSVAKKIVDELSRLLAREEEIMRGRKEADQRMLDSLRQLQGGQTEKVGG